MGSGQGRPRICGVGIACIDYLFVGPWVGVGGQARLREHAVEGGGLVGTALVAAARLGAETEIRTWVGDDPEGESVAEGLRREGVGVSGLEVIRGARTPVSFVHVEEGTGERTIYHRGNLGVSGARAARAGEGIACDVLLVDGVWPEASAAAARAAREAGIPVVGDLCPEGRRGELGALVTALIVSRGCAERLAPKGSWEERLGGLAALGPSFAAITAGGEGCYYLEEGRVRHQPAFAVDVVDTTGAGDVFHGAFAYALARGWGVSRGVGFASAVAGLSCRALGGRRAIPTLAEALAFLAEHGAEER